MTNLLASSRPLRQAAVCFLGLLLIASPAFAHHPLGMGDTDALTAWQGLLSGLGHPVLGPDHCCSSWPLASLSCTVLCAGCCRCWRSVSFIPLLDAAALWAEALVSRSLAVEGLIALSMAPAALLLPLFGLHGFLLGSTIVGAEPTPLFSYFLGLLIVQGSLFLLVTALSQGLVDRLGAQGQRLGAGIWIGIGMAFAWVALID